MMPALHIGFAVLRPNGRILRLQNRSKTSKIFGIIAVSNESKILGQDVKIRAGVDLSKYWRGKPTFWGENMLKTGKIYHTHIFNMWVFFKYWGPKSTPQPMNRRRLFEL